MEDQYLIPGEAWQDETASTTPEQFLVPGDSWVENDDTAAPPGPGGRRRPTIICGG